MRILYGVAGEGMGHATRAKALLDDLQQHTIKVVSSSRAASYLESKGFSVSRVTCLKIIYRNNSVTNTGIFAYHILVSPFILWSLLKTLVLAFTFKPDVIVTDFDAYTCYAGWILRIPIVSVGNQELMMRAKLQLPGSVWWESFKTKFITRLIIPRATRHVVTAFSTPSAPNTVLVGPIIRKELMRETTLGEHVLVYQTSKTNRRLLRVLQSVPAKFIVYGLNREGTEGNVTFKRFNESAFANDLASCRAVIMNGGYSLMSEAIVLGKPVLSEPVRKQFEQDLNARLLEREGFGQRTPQIGAMQITSFLLKKFKTYQGPIGNKKVIDAIERAF